MIKTENFEKIEIKSSKELRSWLLKNHNQTKSVWLVTYKKSTPTNYVSRWDVLDVLICFGWIDGIRRALDKDRTMQLISPRKTQHWARTYKERATRLIKEDLMHEAGLKSIKISKQNGLWHFMDDVDNLIIPDDLLSALSNSAGAKDFFTALNDSSKRFALRWLKLAKTDATRQRRLEKLTNLSTEGEKLRGS